MAYRWHKWEAASANCSGGPQPGATALMNWCLTNYQTSRNLGIYNCRTVRGSTAPSMHGEGRAIDVGFPVAGGKAHADGHRLLEDLAKKAGELGLQCIIWDRRIFSARSPRGRRYSGANPHIDHLHVELTRGSAESLTSQTIAQILGRQEADSAPEQTTKPVVYPTLRHRRPMMTGEAVRRLQTLLNDFRVVKMKVDGIFGPKTASAVARFQLSKNLKPDGIVGPKTWAALVTKPSKKVKRPTLRLTRPYTRGKDVTFLQTKLKNIRVDGVFGPKTERAVKAFQRQNGLVADGIVGPKTWNALIS